MAIFIFKQLHLHYFSFSVSPYKYSDTTSNNYVGSFYYHPKFTVPLKPVAFFLFPRKDVPTSLNK
jgi:hypothetical protein